MTKVLREIKADEPGFQTYFNFRSKSEQAVLREASWERSQVPYPTDLLEQARHLANTPPRVGGSVDRKLARASSAERLWSRSP